MNVKYNLLHREKRANRMNLETKDLLH